MSPIDEIQTDALLVEAAARIQQLEDALKRIRDCDWVISLPDRMDAVRAMAREGLATTEAFSVVGATDNDSLTVGEPAPGEDV